MITLDDIVFNYSGSGNNSDPDYSIGGESSTVELATHINSLFDNGTAIDSYIGSNDYRCVYLHNTSGTDPLLDIKVWVAKDNKTTSNTVLTGADPIGIDGIAQTISRDSVAPTGVDFIPAHTEGSCYSLASLAAGSSIPLWFMRDFVESNNETLLPDPVNIYVSVGV